MYNRLSIELNKNNGSVIPVINGGDFLPKSHGKSVKVMLKMFKNRQSQASFVPIIFQTA